MERREGGEMKRDRESCLDKSIEWSEQRRARKKSKEMRGKWQRNEREEKGDGEGEGKEREANADIQTDCMTTAHN